MLRLLLVHHTVSSPMSELLELVAKSANAAARDLEIDLEVRTGAALSVGADAVLEADGIILGSPINIGYISGALKHFFDQIYYPCLAETRGLPFAAYLHGNSDGAGAVRALENITNGLAWRAISNPVLVVNGFDATVRAELAEATSLVVAAMAEAV